MIDFVLQKFYETIDFSIEWLDFRYELANFQAWSEFYF